MSNVRRRMLFHGLAVLVLAAAAVFLHYGINAIADVFIDARQVDARLFASLVKDNWNGISTLSNEKKEILIRNLDPAMAGADIRTRRDLMLVLMYVGVGVFVIQVLDSAVKTWKAGDAKHAL